MRRLYHFLLLFPLAVTLLYSCGIRHTAAVLDDVETYIQERPDSALATLRAIDTTTLATRSLRAQYALLNATALDKNWIDTTDVSVVMPAVTYYDRHPSGLNRAKAWYYLGRIQENGGDYPKAIFSFTRSMAFMEKMEDNRFKAMISAAIARLYSTSFDYEEALVWDNTAYGYCVDAFDSILINSCRERLAIDYTNLEQYERADSLFNVLIADHAHIFPQLFPSILAEYAFLNVNLCQYDKACQLYRQSLALQPRFNSRNHWGAYAYALAENGQKTQADSIFKLLESPGAQKDIVYTGWKSQMEAGRQNYKEAYDLLNQTSQQQETNLRKALQQTILKSQRNYYEDSYFATSRENRLLRIIGFLLGLSLLVGGAFIGSFIYRRHRQSQEREYALIDKARTLLRENDTLQNERMELNHHYSRIFQQYFNDLGELLKTAATANTGNMQIKQSILFDKVDSAWKAVLSDDHGNEVFEEQLNTCFDDIMLHFRKEFPDCDENFYRFAGYVFAGFDNDLLMILCHTKSRNSVYSRKKRLRQMITGSNVQHRDEYLSLL